MKNKENALFAQRLVAYILDVLIIATVASLISIPFSNSDNIEKLSNNNTQLMEKYTKKEISTTTYIKEYIDISYEVSRQQGLITLVSIFLSILYFIVYQFYKGGQTLGKKLMNIKIESNDDSELTMNQLIYRALIINSIFVDMVSLALIIFASKEICFYTITGLELVKNIIIIVSAIMVMFTKKSRGLHDYIANTKVVRVDAVKEMETCES